METWNWNWRWPKKKQRWGKRRTWWACISDTNEGKRTSHYTKKTGLLFLRSVKNLSFFIWVNTKCPQSWDCPFKQVTESPVTGLHCMIQEAQVTIMEKNYLLKIWKACITFYVNLKMEKIPPCYFFFPLWLLNWFLLLFIYGYILPSAFSSSLFFS